MQRGDVRDRSEGAASIQDRAVLVGLEETIFDFMYRGATPQQWAEWLRAPLEHAAAAADLEVVETLLLAGADGSAGWKGCRDRSLLCAAVQGGSHEVVKSLLKAGSRPDINTRSGEKMWSPLHYAAAGGHTAMARILMMAGADSEYLDVDKCSALHLAAYGGHEQIVCDLLLNGAPHSPKDKRGETPLHAAAKQGHTHIVPILLLTGANANILDNNMCTPLHLAAQYGRVPMIKALLAAGADMSLHNLDNISSSALTLAARFGHVEAVKALIEHGADLNSTHSTSMNALHTAAYFNQGGVVSALLEAGADPNAPDGVAGWTPLHFASWVGSCDAMRVLLTYDVKVDAKTAAGQRPLGLACQYLAVEAAELLLGSGADETCMDNYRRCASHLIGKSIRATDLQDRADDVQRLRVLLAGAPGNRAWRRRSVFVLCRAFPDNARLLSDRGRPESTGAGVSGGGSTAGGGVAPWQQGRASGGHRSRGGGARVTWEVSINNGRFHSYPSRSYPPSDEHVPARPRPRDAFARLLARLVLLEDERAFRCVVCFL